MSDNWSFIDSKPFLTTTEKTIGETDSPEYGETGWQTAISYNEAIIEVTFFPESNGVRVSGSDGLTESVGKEGAVLGVALIKLLRSGANCFNEV